MFSFFFFCYEATRKKVLEERKRCRQQMDQLREELDEAQRKIIRLETQQLNV